MFPLVSIIIPCYNSEIFVQQAISSALAQTYRSVEVIVIDDGSTDGSLDIIRSFGKDVRWETGQNRGGPIARNRGLELAQGKFIKFLDADDVLLPNCLEHQVAQEAQLAMDRKSIVYGDAIWVDPNCNSLPGHLHRARRLGEDPVAHILEQSPLTSCPLHRREYLLEVGGFDPTITKGQEHDLHLRLVLAGVEFIYQSGAIYKYREHHHPDRISNHAYSRKSPLAHFETLQKQLSIIEQKMGQTLSTEVRKVLARRYWAYGRGVLREGYKREASCYFTAARQLDSKHCVTGNMPYPTFVHLFGPYGAEKILQLIRGLQKWATS